MDFPHDFREVRGAQRIQAAQLGREASNGLAVLGSVENALGRVALGRCVQCAIRADVDARRASAGTTVGGRRQAIESVGGARAAEAENFGYLRSASLAKGCLSSGSKGAATNSIGNESIAGATAPNWCRMQQ